MPWHIEERDGKHCVIFLQLIDQGVDDVKHALVIANGWGV